MKTAFRIYKEELEAFKKCAMALSVEILDIEELPESVRVHVEYKYPHTLFYLGSTMTIQQRLDRYKNAESR